MNYSLCLSFIVVSPLSVINKYIYVYMARAYDDVITRVEAQTLTRTVGKAWPGTIRIRPIISMSEAGEAKRLNYFGFDTFF